MKVANVAAALGALTILVLIGELRQDRRVLIEEMRRDHDALAASQAATSDFLRARVAALVSDNAIALRPRANRAGAGTARTAVSVTPHAVEAQVAGNAGGDPDASACDERGPGGLVQVHCSGPAVAPVPPDDPITREWQNPTPLGMTDNYVPASIRLTEVVMLHLASLPPIPKRIHLCWAHDGILNATYRKLEMIRRGVGNLTKSNPSWTATVWDDAAMETYIKRRIAPHDYELVKDAYVVEKTDLFRLLLMYHEGGIYQDIDRLYDRGPIDSIIRASTRIHLPWWSDINFSQDIMMSSPGSLVFLNAIRFNLKIRRQLEAQKMKQGKTTANGKHRSRKELLELGPSAYMYALTYTLFGLRTLPSKPRLDDEAHSMAAPVLRRAMEASPHLQTMNEHGNATECSTTFSYVEKECFRTWGLKRKFLDPQKRGDWTSELKEAAEPAGR